jgi:hypothetical protein
MSAIAPAAPEPEECSDESAVLLSLLRLLFVEASVDADVSRRSAAAISLAMSSTSLCACSSAEGEPPGLDR